METGKDSVVIGNIPIGTKIGDGSVIIGATDGNGNTIINTPMAVGRGAKAGKESIAIGAFAGAGIENTNEVQAISNQVKKLWFEKPYGIIFLGALASLLAWAILHYYGFA